MSGERNRLDGGRRPSIEKDAQIPDRDAERSLVSGEALDDDELDALCDATLARIGDDFGRQSA